MPVKWLERAHDVRAVDWALRTGHLVPAAALVHARLGSACCRAAPLSCAYGHVRRRGVPCPVTEEGTDHHLWRGAVTEESKEVWPPQTTWRWCRGTSGTD